MIRVVVQTHRKASRACLADIEHYSPATAT
jgi:hypothetical protein